MCGPTISSVGMYVSLVFIFLISKVLNIVESFLNDVLSTFSLIRLCVCVCVFWLEFSPLGNPKKKPNPVRLIQGIFVEKMRHSQLDIDEKNSENHHI